MSEPASPKLKAEIADFPLAMNLTLRMNLSRKMKQMTVSQPESLITEETAV
jgi:hypothetical protein